MVGFEFSSLRAMSTTRRRLRVLLFGGVALSALGAATPTAAQEYPQGRLVEDPTASTQISGRSAAGSSAWPRNVDGGISGIEWWERADNPCRLRVTGQAIGGTSSSTETFDVCHDNAVGNRREVAFVPRWSDDPAWGVWVTRLRVCMNRASSVAAARRGRLVKGIQIQGIVVYPWGQERMSSEDGGSPPFDVAKGANCLDDDQQAWEPWVGCSADSTGAPRFATRVVVHYEEDPGPRQSRRITGLSLRCGTLRPTEPRRQLILGPPDEGAAWAGLPARPGIPDVFVKSIGFAPGGAGPQRAIDTVRLHDIEVENKPCRVGIVGKNVNVPWDSRAATADCHHEVAVERDGAVASLGSSTYGGAAGGPQWPPNAFVTAIRVCRSHLAGRPSEIKGIRLDGVTVDDLARVTPMTTTLGRPSAELPGCVHNDLDLPHSASAQIGLSSQCLADPRRGGGARIATGLKLHFAETQVHPVTGLPMEPTALVGIQLVCSSVQPQRPEMTTGVDPPRAAVQKPGLPGGKTKPAPTGDKGPGLPDNSAAARLHGWALGDVPLYVAGTIGNQGDDPDGQDVLCPSGKLVAGLRIAVEMIDTVNRVVGMHVHCHTVADRDPSGRIFRELNWGHVTPGWGRTSFGPRDEVGPGEVIIALVGKVGAGHDNLRALTNAASLDYMAPTEPANPTATWGRDGDRHVWGNAHLTPTVFSPIEDERAECPSTGPDNSGVRYVLGGIKLHRQEGQGLQRRTWLRGVTLLCKQLVRVPLELPVRR